MSLRHQSGRRLPALGLAVLTALCGVAAQPASAQDVKRDNTPNRGVAVMPALPQQQPQPARPQAPARNVAPNVGRGQPQQYSNRPPDHGRDPMRPRYESPHWVYDDRYRHDRFYPAPGYTIKALPRGHVVITSPRLGRYFFHGGVWYRQGPAGFLAVRPPPGLLTPVLPPSYATVWVGGLPYYYANDIYYSASPGGYIVAQPTVTPDMGVPPAAPMQTEPPQMPPPQAGVPQQVPPGAQWYYCESGRAYYPYVNECPEGWRAVPAQPPQR